MYQPQFLEIPPFDPQLHCWTLFFGMSVWEAAAAAPSLVKGLLQESLHLDHLEATFILCLLCFGLCPATQGWDLMGRWSTKILSQLRPKLKAAYWDMLGFEFCTASSSNLPFQSNIWSQIPGSGLCNLLSSLCGRLQVPVSSLETTLWCQRQFSLEDSWAPGFWEPSGRPPESTVQSLKDWDAALPERKRTRMVMVIQAANSYSEKGCFFFKATISLVCSTQAATWEIESRAMNCFKDGCFPLYLLQDISLLNAIDPR